jgi:hypothetical protein
MAFQQDDGRFAPTGPDAQAPFVNDCRCSARDKPAEGTGFNCVAQIANLSLRDAAFHLTGACHEDTFLELRGHQE